MNRCHLLVEGQTEETFANRTIVPHLYSIGFHSVSVVVVATKRPASGGKYRGGIGSWTHLQKDIRLLVKDSDAIVTTLVDFYGLPADVPGVQDLEASWSATKRVSYVEEAIKEAIASANFLAHVVLHELEALLYSDPVAAAAHFGDDTFGEAMEADLKECGEPELVNEGLTTAPSKRIIKHNPQYLKTSDGPTILADIGLPAIRLACPHFDSWLKALEGHAQRN